MVSTLEANEFLMKLIDLTSGKSVSSSFNSSLLLVPRYICEVTYVIWVSFTHFLNSSSLAEGLKCGLR